MRLCSPLRYGEIQSARDRGIDLRDQPEERSNDSGYWHEASHYSINPSPLPTLVVPTSTLYKADTYPYYLPAFCSVLGHLRTQPPGPGGLHPIVRTQSTITQQPPSRSPPALCQQQHLAHGFSCSPKATLNLELGQITSLGRKKKNTAKRKEKN